ncbi:MAG: hypothetical protein NZL96_03400 [Patescibacteria group bacterium]|nr:hypothetical protein [Patescibacteria group bacterium]
MNEGLNKLIITITDKEIIDLILNYNESEREKIIIRALKIGLIALKNIETTTNVDYVEKEFQKFISQVDKEFIQLKNEFENRLKETDELIQKKLTENFDPQSGLMSRVLEQYLGEGGRLSDLFDEENNSSATAKIKKILAEYFDSDASKVVSLLNPNNPESPLSTFKKEMMERLIAIEKEIKASQVARKAVEEEREKGTQKGLDYENLVFAQIEKIASIFGDTCLPTGRTSGLMLDSKVGDIVVTLNSASTGGAILSMVFEAKDKQMNLSALLEELERAKENRNAQASVAVLSGKNVIKDVNQTIGVFRDYSNNRTICVLDKIDPDPVFLEVAYKLVRAKLLLALRVREMRSGTIDLALINNLIEEIIKKLDNLSLVKGTLTKASGFINKAQEDLDKIKEEIRKTLTELSEKTKIPNKN